MTLATLVSFSGYSTTRGKKIVQMFLKPPYKTIIFDF